MTGKDSRLFHHSDHSELNFLLRNEMMIDRENERLSVSCLQILRF